MELIAVMGDVANGLAYEAHCPCFVLWRCYVTTLRASLAPHNSLKYQAQQEYDDGEYGNAIAYAHQALAVLRVRTHVGVWECQHACDS